MSASKSAAYSTNRIICTGAVNGSDTERIDDHTSFVHGFVRAAEIASNTQWKSEDGSGKGEQAQEIFLDSHGRSWCRFLLGAGLQVTAKVSGVVCE